MEKETECHTILNSEFIFVSLCFSIIVYDRKIFKGTQLTREEELGLQTMKFVLIFHLGFRSEV